MLHIHRIFIIDGETNQKYDMTLTSLRQNTAELNGGEAKLQNGAKIDFKLVFFRLVGNKLHPRARACGKITTNVGSIIHVYELYSNNVVVLNS